MKEETIKVKETFRRFVQNADVLIERAADGKVRTLKLSATSEALVPRFFGKEHLIHETGAVRMQRAKSGAMPLLFNHNVNDPIGMVRTAWLDDSRMMVEAELFDTARADEVEKMIKGGLRNVSTGYEIHKVEEDKKDHDLYHVRDWEPFEVSIVTVPADHTVGVGREYEMRMYRNDSPTPEANGADGLTRRAVMDPKETNGAEGTAVGAVAVEPKKELTPMQYEDRRSQAIKNLCQMNRLDEKYVAMFIGQGQTVETISDEILEIVKKRGESNPQSTAKLGLGHRDTERFSWMKAIHACAIQNWSNAPFELECSREIAKRMQKVPDPQKFYIPYEVLERSVGATHESFLPGGRRDLTVGTTTAGGFLVDTQNMGFIDLLRARSVAFRMGARRLSGLVGNVTIPRLSAAGTMYWLATEATAITESQQTFEQVSLSPNTAGAYTEISRQLLLQSNPGAEQIVTNDLSTIVALGVDLAVLAGTGGAQPQGIIGTSGVGTVTGTTMAYAGVLEFQTDVANAQVQPVSGGYVTTPTIAGQLMTRVKFTNTGTPLWEGNVWDGSMAGFPAMSSTQVPTGDIVFGDWSEVVVAEWGVLEVEVNPYANFQAGIIGVRCMYSMDSTVKRPAAFSVATSVT